MSELNVLYACNEKYAPFAGISLTSLFINNINIEKITAYIVVDQVSMINIDKFNQLAVNFNRKLVVIDAEKLIEKIRELNIPSYRGSYTTNFRLFFQEIVKNDIDKLVYLDCDTIIQGSLKSLLEIDMEKKCIGVVLDSLGSSYKHLIGFNPRDKYFNAGVMLISVSNWIEQECTQQLVEHINNIRSMYCNPDQDLLNIILKNKTIILPPEYNYQPFHRIYSNKVYFSIYDKSNYYTDAQLARANRNPIILHTYRYLGEFPWHKRNLHPDNKLFNEYMEISLWSDYHKEVASFNFLFKIEKILYCILPRLVFLRLFSIVQGISFSRQENRLKKIVL